MDFIIRLFIFALDIYLYIIIATVLISWLVAFGVLNTRNKWVYKFCELLNTVTNPVVLRLRKIIPPMGGIDITPLVIIMGIYILQNILYGMLY